MRCLYYLWMFLINQGGDDFGMDAGIYNNLLTTYTPKTLNKYDTHKSSELRTIVNKIAKIASSSPVYLVNLTDAKQTYALGVKESSMLLHKGFEALSDDSQDGIFSKKKAYSSMPESVEAEIIGDDYEKLPDEFNIKVNKLAKPQINEGNPLYPDSRGLEAGTYKFRISVADDIYDFQYNVKPNATNGEVIEGLSSFINKAKIGLTASMEYAEGSDRHGFMRIQSDMTGSSAGERIFYIEDRAGDNNQIKTGMVEYLGLNNVAKMPESSEFYMDGMEKHTLSNEFTISKSLKVSLNQVSDDVSIAYKPDSEKILSGIQDIMSAYNYMVESTETYSKTTSQHLKLLTEMKYVMKPFVTELESCGISFDESGRMRMDDSLATQAVNDGDMQKLFGPGAEFAGRMLKKTDEVKLNPMDYVDKVTVTYPNYKKAPEGFSYITSLYSGMLFNYYC